MNLAQFLARLAQGPVGDLAIGGDASGTVPADKVPNLVRKAQGVLTELYTRFPLSVKTLTLVLVDGLFLYPLRQEYALTSGSPQVHKFIHDSASHPFTGDVLAIEHVLDSDRQELGLNDRGNCTSWFTTDFDTLSMDYPTQGATYFVQYRADHPVLDPEDNVQEIRLPAALEEAFLAKVGYEVFAAQTGESAAIKSQELLAKYNHLCAEIEGRNVVNSSTVQARHDQIKHGGWA